VPVLGPKYNADGHASFSVAASASLDFGTGFG
jgi:hypothetical protein